MMIRGRDITLFAYDDDVATPIYCATSCSIAVDAETIPITTINSGREDEYEGGATNGTLDLSSGITLDSVGGWQFEDFVDEVGNKHRFLIQFTNDYGDILSYAMDAIITSVSGRGDVTDFGLFDASMLRSGPMVKIKTIEGGLVDSEGDYIIDSNGKIIRG